MDKNEIMDALGRCVDEYLFAKKSCLDEKLDIDRVYEFVTDKKFNEKCRLLFYIPDIDSQRTKCSN